MSLLWRAQLKTSTFCLALFKGDADLELDLNNFLTDVSSGSAWLWMRWHVLSAMIPFRLKISSSALRSCVFSRSEDWNGMSKLSQVHPGSSRLSQVIPGYLRFIHSFHQFISSSHFTGKDLVMPSWWFRWWVESEPQNWTSHPPIICCSLLWDLSSNLKTMASRSQTVKLPEGIIPPIFHEYTSNIPWIYHQYSILYPYFIPIVPSVWWSRPWKTQVVPAPSQFQMHRQCSCRWSGNQTTHGKGGLGARSGSGLKGQR